MARAIEKFTEKSGDQLSAQHPRLVWSGEGGSFLLGNVHLSESIVALMRGGNVDAAIETYLQREQIHISPNSSVPDVLENARDVIKQGIREELDQFHAADPGRNFYLYMAHERSAAQTHASFRKHRSASAEFQLPFFDAQFVLSIMETTLDWCLRHKFYLKWLSKFPSTVTAVPWQAYPGHEPCPLPVPPAWLSMG